MAREAWAVALLCAAAFGAADCGGGDDTGDFRKSYNAIVKQYTSLPVEIGSAVRGASAKSDKALEKQFDDLADRLSDEVAKLRKLDPPDDAKDEYDAFVAGLAKVDDDLRAISDAANVHSSSRAEKGARALVRHSRDVSKEEDALKEAVD
jgi:hypothetical protein